MIELLSEWQQLASGVLAVIAGALIFIEGARGRQSRAADEARDVREWLQLLRERCADLGRSIREDGRSLQDSAEELERADAQAQIRQLVPPDVFPRAAGMKIILQQLMSRRAPYRVLLVLSELVELLDIYESDFRSFRGAVLGEIRESRRSQQVLSFARVEPAWQKAYGNLELSTMRVRGKLKEIGNLLGERAARAPRDNVQDTRITNESKQRSVLPRLRAR